MSRRLTKREYLSMSSCSQSTPGRISCRAQYRTEATKVDYAADQSFGSKLERRTTNPYANEQKWDLAIKFQDQLDVLKCVAYCFCLHPVHFGLIANSSCSPCGRQMHFDPSFSCDTVDGDVNKCLQLCSDCDVPWFNAADWSAKDGERYQLDQDDKRLAAVLDDDCDIQKFNHNDKGDDAAGIHRGSVRRKVPMQESTRRGPVTTGQYLVATHPLTVCVLVQRDAPRRERFSHCVLYILSEA